MAELLIKAISHSLPDPEADRQGCYKAGMPVVVMPDGHLWGTKECWPSFAFIKVPLISVEKVRKYIEPQPDPILGEEGPAYRRRRWCIRWDDLPQGAKDKLRDTGQLIIKATAEYTDPYDYTWAQVKGYFHNLETDTDETDDL